MKKFFLCTILVISTLFSFAQSYDIKLKKNADYSKFVYSSKQQIWQLQGIAHNNRITAVFFQITINNNQEGWFSFPSNIYISGDFNSISPVLLTINGEEFSFDKPYTYERWNKGKKADCVLYFNRIPAGISRITYCEPNFIYWPDIPVSENNSDVVHSTWTEESLRSYWDNNKSLFVEGIYYFTSTNNKEWWGTKKHTLAVIKEGYEYKIIYLRGSDPGIWKEGDVKATFIPTATRGLYKATSWYMENKINNEDFYLSFKEGLMSIYENTSNTSADFLKLYPASDENYEVGRTSGTIGQQSSPITEKSKATGSGIFVSSNVIATNYHVINKAQKIEIIIKDGNNVSTHKAKILSADKTNDLALLSIDDSDFNGFGDIPYFISPSTNDVGTSIFTMGYPMANYMGEEVKITDGIINSKTGFEGDIVTYQISAPIQPGNSGGPLFNKKGELIGITNAGITAAQNVGYAIKSSYLCNLIESAPISIILPKTTKIANMELVDQIKTLSKYVVLVKVY